MNIKEFEEYVKAGLPEKLGEPYSEVATARVVRNNGVEYKGIYLKGANRCLSPTIYLDYFYNLYKLSGNAEMVLDKIAEYVSDHDSRLSIEIKDYEDFSNVKDHIVCRLVSYEKNRELLKDTPYVPYADLAITFRWVAKNDERIIATSVISNQDMERWNVAPEEIYNIAIENTKRLFPYQMNSVIDMLTSHDRVFPAEAYPLYVLTNKFFLNGATSIIFPEVLDECTELAGGDIYIIPSSVHEVLFVLASETDSSELREMLITVSDSAITESEYLSDKIYYYSKKEKILKIMEN
jgi:hypothetical protein